MAAARPFPWLFVALAVGLAAGPAVAEQTDYGEDQVLVYEILRDGRPLGTQHFAVQRQVDQVTVDLRTEIDYRLLSLSLYTFRQDGREVWRDGRLVELETATDDNGTALSLKVQRQDGGMVIRQGGDVRREAGDLAPASLWNAAALRHQRLIDTIDGSILPVEISAAHPDQVSVAGETRPATHYKITGGLRREVWYGTDGRLLRVSFVASDGSHVEYRLKDARPLTLQ